jgi:uncharacterized protein (TIRG00374 family)
MLTSRAGMLKSLGLHQLNEGSCGGWSVAEPPDAATGSGQPPEADSAPPRIVGRAFYRDPRYAILAVLIAAIAVLAVVKRAELAELWAKLGKLNTRTVLLALACQVGKFAAVALTFHLLLRVLNHRIPIPYLFGSGLVMVFLNQAVPSMGTSGNAFMYTALQRRGVSGGNAIIVTILNMLTYYIAFFLLAVSAMIYLALARALTGEQVVGAFVFFGMMIALFLWIRFRTQRRDRFERTISDINRLVARVSRGALSQAIPEHFVSDFFEGRALIIGAKRRFVLPVLTNLCMFLADLTTLYVVFRGLGQQVLYRYVAAAYVLGIILYAFAIVPGALGIYEAALTAMLKAFRISTTTGLAGIILFRGFSFWLPIPVGFAIYQLMLRRRRREAPEPEPTASGGPT